MPDVSILRPLALSVIGLSASCGSDDEGEGLFSGSGAMSDSGAPDVAAVIDSGSPSVEDDASSSTPGPSSGGDSGPAEPRPDQNAPYTCGDGECFAVGGLDPCCTDDGACGAMYLGASGAGCVPTNGGGRIDPACPEAADGPGCCMPNGKCGAFYSRAFGCVDSTLFPSPGAIDVECGPDGG